MTEGAEPRFKKPGIYRLVDGPLAGALFDIQGADVQLWGQWWGEAQGIVAIMLFAARMGKAKRVPSRTAYYGKSLATDDAPFGTGLGYVVDEKEIGEWVRESTLKDRHAFDETG